MNGDSKVTPDRKRQILDAAETCFRNEGFHGASMGRIACAAGISVGHIYRYFENKEAVVAAIVARDLDESLLAISALPGAAQAQFDTMVEVTREHGKAEHMALWLEVLAEAARNPRVAAMVRDADAQLRASIVESFAPVPGCKVSQADACARAELVCTLFEGALVRSLRRGSCDPLELPVLRDVLMWALNGCVGDPRGSAEAHQPLQAVGGDRGQGDARERQTREP